VQIHKDRFLNISIPIRHWRWCWLWIKH